MKRIIVFIVAALFLTTFSSGVMAAEIEFWTTDTQADRISTVELLASTFKSLTGHTVKVRGVDEKDVPTAVASAAAAGTLPNVLHAGSGPLSAFSNQDMMDQAAHADVIKAVGKDKFYNGALRLFSEPDGSYNGVPFYGWIQGVWYRADWFKKEGLEPPDTWDKILKAAKHFHKPENKQYGILVGTKIDQFSEQIFTQLALSNGGGEFDAKGNLIFNSPEIKETLKFYTDLAKLGPPGQNTWRARDYYLQNRMAMFFYSTFIMDDIALAEAAANSLTSENFKDLEGAKFDEQLVEKTAFAPLITKKKPSSYGVQTGFGIFKTDSAETLKATKAWLEFLLKEESLVAWCHTGLGGMNPVIKSVAESDAYLDDPKGLFERYGKEKIIAIVAGLEGIADFSIVEGRMFPEANLILNKQIIPQMIYKAVWDNKSVDDSVKWATDEMQKVVTEHRKK